MPGGILSSLLSSVYVSRRTFLFKHCDAKAQQRNRTKGFSPPGSTIRFYSKRNHTAAFSQVLHQPLSRLPTRNTTCFKPRSEAPLQLRSRETEAERKRKKTAKVEKNRRELKEKNTGCYLQASWTTLTNGTKQSNTRGVLARLARTRQLQVFF